MLFDTWKCRQFQDLRSLQDLWILSVAALPGKTMKPADSWEGDMASPTTNQDPTRTPPKRRKINSNFPVEHALYHPGTDMRPKSSHHFHSFQDNAFRLGQDSSPINSNETNIIIKYWPALREASRCRARPLAAHASVSGDAMGNRVTHRHLTEKQNFSHGIHSSISHTGLYALLPDLPIQKLF